MKIATQLLPLVLSLFLSACTGENDAKLRAPIVIGTSNIIKSLDPHQAKNELEIAIASSLYLGLVRIDTNGQIAPGVAQSWNVSPDGKTYIFRLRKIKWSNGKSITSKTFEKSLQRLFVPKFKNPWVEYFSGIENGNDIITEKKPLSDLGVHALTEDVLEIRLKSPQPTFLALLATPAGAPVENENFLVKNTIITNGAYKVKQVTPRKLELIPDYIYALSGVEKRSIIDIRLNSDTAKTMSSFLGGEYDILDGSQLPPDVIQSKGKLRDQLTSSPSGVLSGIFFNSNQPYLKKQNLRLAISLLLPRQELPTILASTISITPTAALIPAGVTGYSPPAQPEWALWSIEQKQLEAKRLITESGYSLAKPITLILLGSRSAEDQAVASWVQQSLEPFGLKIKYQASSTPYQSYSSGNYDLFLSRWETLVDSPDFILQNFTCVTRRFYNISCDAQLKALTVDAFATSNITERNQKFRQVERLLLQASIVAPLYQLNRTVLVSPKIYGWPIAATVTPSFERLSRSAQVKK
jgi:oligopeptide transport system substrate-binding protein